MECVSKYFLFYCPKYYPSGGFGDYEGSYDTLEEAKQSVLIAKAGAEYQLCGVNEEGDLACFYTLEKGEWVSIYDKRYDPIEK